MRWIAGLVAAAAVASPVLAETDTGLARGREATAQLLSGDAATLAARMSQTFLDEIGGVDGLATFLATVAVQVGGEQELLAEHVFREFGRDSYFRRARFAKAPDITVRWVFAADGTIEAGSVLPTQQPADSAYLDYRTKAALRLPLAAPREGRWYVGWGGRDTIHNYHAAFPDQRFAYDLYIAKDGSPYRTDGKSNADYYCFGEPILAPAAGTVAKTVDGLPDNPPGVMDPANPVGNHVVIDHGDGEFSFLAHLQNGSLVPKLGERVAAGHRIGRCGNSGNTTMPHLHYHLQTTPVFARGAGLPAQFIGYGEPTRGEYLDP